MKLLTLLGVRRSGLLLLLSIIAPFFLLKPLGIQMSIVLLFCLSWLLGKSPRKLGPWLFTLGSLGAGLISYYTYSTLKGIAPAVALLTLLGLVQSFDLKSLKEFTLFILICQLLLLSQLLDEYSLWFALYIGAISLYLFLLMARFHKLVYAKEGQGSPVRRKLIRQIFLYSLPLTFGLFILFPRLPLGSFFSMKQRAAGVTGFTSHLRPGEMSKIANDDTIYFRATIAQESVPMPLLYWRGGVLSENNGFNWDKGKILSRRDHQVKEKGLFKYGVTLSTLESSPLFHLKGSKNISKASPGYQKRDPGGIIYFNPYANQKTKYQAEFSGVDKEWIEKRDVDKYLQVSSVSQKVIDLAQILKKEDAKDTYDSIGNYFQKNKFIYSLDPGTSTLESFLFETKKGFCEHFASSAALLLRLSGVPSRVITGFHGGIYNSSGGYYQVRGQDAHAWLEYWDGTKWNRADPTELIAPERINFGYEGLVLRDQLPDGMGLRDFLGLKTSSYLTQIAFAWDSFYNNLNQKFLEYDSLAQRELFNFSKFKRYTGIILFSFCLALFGGFGYLWQRSLKSRPSALDKAYTNFLRKLEKAGIEKARHEGALTLERRLPANWGGFEDGVRILRLYREIVYREKIEKLDQLLTEINLFRPAKIEGKEL